MKKSIKQVYTVSSRLEAESICLLLQSFGIAAEISQESVASTLGLTVGPLAKIKILVNNNQVRDAREILQAMDRGELTINPDDPGTNGLSDQKSE